MYIPPIVWAFLGIILVAIFAWWFIGWALKEDS
jgi:hypothetical protein